MTLFKKGHKPKRVRGHLFVCFHELVLMHLGLRKEELFAFLLHCGQLHCLTEVASVVVAEELHSTPHEFMHWQECGLLGSAKPTNQLVANIWQPGNCIKAVPETLIKVLLCEVDFVGALLTNKVGPFDETYVLKTLTHQVKQYRTIFHLGFRELSEYF
jgi:hypothetical protein